MRKLFVGTSNLAGNAFYISEALKTQGIYAKSYSFKKHSFGYSCDFNGLLFIPPKTTNPLLKVLINRFIIKTIHFLQRTYLLISSILRYDTFFFISIYTFYRNNSDLKLLKFLGKQINFIFVGCLERDPEDSINKNDRGFCSFCTDEGLMRYCKCNDLIKKRSRISYVSSFADNVFTHRDTISYIGDKRKVKKIFIICKKPIKDNLNRFNDISKRIVISHFPSNSLLKSSKEVYGKVNALKDPRIDFFSQRMTNSEVLENLENTHILIDQFGSSHGLLAVEAMARGCVVICRLSKWFIEDFPEIPIVNCEVDELDIVIRSLINDHSRMKELSEKSRQYYIKYHSPEAVGKYYSQILKLT